MSLVLELDVFLLGDHITPLLTGIAGFEHEVGFIIDYLFYLTDADIAQVGDPRGEALQVPDMAHRDGELDMTHPFAADTGLGHLDAAAVADNTAIPYPLVLAALALPIADRAEDSLAEKTVSLRLEGAVIYRFRLGDLAI